MNNVTEHIFILNTGQGQSSALSQKLVDVELPGTALTSLENVADFSNVCRTCATITEFVIPIFAGEGLQNNLAEKIHKHLPIKVSEADVLPRVVCYQCASTLLAWHELVQCCVQADAALRARVLQPTQESKCSNPKPNSTLREDTENKLFYTNVRNVLLNNFLNDLDEDDLDVEFVCQKCTEKPALATVLSLAEHMQYDHSSDIAGDDTIETFITNHVTFEQMLMEDSDRETSSEKKEKSLVMLPSLLCPFCADVFSSPTRLVYHLNQHVDVSIEDGFVCCGLLYADTRSFARHLQDAHVTRDDLAAGRARTDTLSADHKVKEHASQSHKEKAKKGKKQQSPNNQKYIPAACPQCGKTFSNKYNMLVHLRGHTGAARFPCDRCQRTYRNQGSLHNHKKLVHKGILNFLCNECGEAFPTRSARDVHHRLHTGDRPYKCDHCGNAYRAKNTLARHVEIHLDVWKYECHICSKKFRRKSHLDYHIKTHKK